MSSMIKNLEKKVVLVSGAGKGIGKEIALTFAAAGSKVAFFDKNQKAVEQVEKELGLLKEKFLAATVDIEDFPAVARFISLVKTRLGPIDILINNVGIGLVKKFFQTSETDYDRVLNTNFKGPFFLTQSVSREMKEGDSIIFITSIHAEHPSLDPTYDASKAAINSLVANLALELAPKGVRVNAVAPGHIDVETKSLARPQPDVPLSKKAGLPKDVAEACLFLADNEKAPYLTGVILPVTGGLHLPIAKDIDF